MRNILNNFIFHHQCKSPQFNSHCVIFLYSVQGMMVELIIIYFTVTLILFGCKFIEVSGIDVLSCISPIYTVVSPEQIRLSLPNAYITKHISFYDV